MDINLLKKLVEAPAISGAEKNVRDVILKEIKPYVDKVSVDKIGNLIVQKGSGSPKVMLAAHMDEVGLMVKHIDKDGFLRFETVGGWDERILPTRKVMVHGSKKSVVGVVGARPVHIQEKDEREKPVKKKDMFIDIGAESDKDVSKAGIRVGDYITNYSHFDALLGTRITGHGFDNRIGCYELIEIAKTLKGFKGTLYLVGTIEEEVGLVGVRGSAFGIDPDVMLAVDTSVGGDVPGVQDEECASKLGKGPMLEIKDCVGIIHPQVKKWLEETAQKEKIALQYDVMSGGATDASVVPMVRSGIPAGALTVPTRYLHTPIEVADTRDVDSAVKLLVAALKNVGKYF